MSNKTKLLGLLLSSIFLALSLYAIDIPTIYNVFRIADYKFIPLAVLLFLFSLCVRSLLWLYILRYNIRYGFRLFLHLMVGLMANNIFPARVGEFVRAYTVGKERDIGKAEVFPSIIIERFLDVFWLFLFLLSACFLDLDSKWPIYLARLIFSFLTLIILISLCVYKFKDQFINLTILFFPNRLKSRLTANLEYYIKVISSGIGSIKGIRLFGAIFLSLISWIFWILFLQFSLFVFHVHLGLPELLILTGIINLGIMIPSSPGNIGTFQFVCIKGLSLFNIDKDIGFSFSVLFHSLWYIPTTLMGVICVYIIGQNILNRDLFEIKKI